MYTHLEVLGCLWRYLFRWSVKLTGTCCCSICRHLTSSGPWYCTACPSSPESILLINQPTIHKNMSVCHFNPRLKRNLPQPFISCHLSFALIFSTYGKKKTFLKDQSFPPVFSLLIHEYPKKIFNSFKPAK